MTPPRQKGADDKSQRNHSHHVSPQRTFFVFNFFLSVTIRYCLWCMCLNIMYFLFLSLFFCSCRISTYPRPLPPPAAPLKLQINNLNNRRITGHISMLHTMKLIISDNVVYRYNTKLAYKSGVLHENKYFENLLRFVGGWRLIYI